MDDTGLKVGKETGIIRLIYGVKWHEQGFTSVRQSKRAVHAHYAIKLFNRVPVRTISNITYITILC